MRAGLALAATIAAAAAIGACGGDSEGTFTAEEFISVANDRGAGLVLGPPLDSGREETTIYELSFEGTGDPASGGDFHGGGSLAVLADADAGLAEYERCERAVSLVCFSAANIALIFDGSLAPADLARVEAALNSMAS